MRPVRDKTYTSLDIFMVILNAIIAVSYFVASYSIIFSANLLGTTIYTSVIGVVHLIYYLTLYRYLRRKSILAASLIGTLFILINLGILLLASGGFGSPYFGLWLIAVLAVGIYRRLVPLALVALSTIYFIAQASLSASAANYLAGHATSLLVLYVTSGLGFWLWHSQHTKGPESQNLSKLSEELTKSEIKSEIVLRGIGDGVILIDTNQRIQLLNEAAEKLTGWSEAEAKGIDYHAVLPLTDMQGTPLTAEQDPFTAAAAKQKSILRDDILLNPRSGGRLTISIMFSAITGEVGFSGGIAIFRDVSQLKAVERQRNEFISTASHEMRSPIAAIEGYIALALNPKISKIDDTGRSYLQKAREATSHLGKLFQDLLSATKIEEGKLPNRPEPVQLDDLIAKVLDEMRFKAEHKKLKLSFSAISQKEGAKKISPLYFSYIDPNRVREVLVNLIDNAIKFTPKGEVTVTLSGNTQDVIIGVKDQGVGIAPHDQGHLFQKFYRVDNSKTRNIGGTGLGLYISRAIVEMYGGRIWVESKLGAGSNFYFTLPRLKYEKAMELIKPRRSAKDDSTVASTASGKVK